MGAIAGFDGDIEARAACGHVEEQSAVMNFEDVRAELAEQGGNGTERPGPVLNGDAVADDPVVAFQLTHHDRSCDTRIDIAAAQDEADFPALEARRIGEHGGEPGGAGAFGHGLLQREEGIHRALELNFFREEDVGNQLPDDRQRQLADVFDCDSFGNGHARTGTLLAVKCIPHRGIERGLDANDFDAGFDRLGGDCDSGNEPTAANRNDQCFDLGAIFQKFEGDRCPDRQ
jgi:hypothetical protein